MTQITIPEGVTSIKDHSFEQCLSLKEIKLPTSLTEIQEYAFQDCKSLENIEFPANVTNISPGTFYNCTALQRVKFPANLNNISHYAFYQCSVLEKANLSEGLINIDYNAFYQCTALKEVSFPSTLATLKDQAFRRCTSLTEITLPASLTYCYHPFYECHNIKKVTCLASVPPTLENDYDILYGVDKSNTELLVPFWSVNSYKLAPGWDAFPTINPLNYETDLINVPGELVIAADIRFKTIQLYRYLITAN